MHSKYSKRGTHRRAASVGLGNEIEKRDFTGPITLTVIIPHDSDNNTPTPIPQPSPTVLPPEVSTSSPGLTAYPPSPSSPPPPADTSSSSFSTTVSTSSTPTLSATTASVTMSNIPAGVISAGNEPQGVDHTPKLSSGAIAGIVIGCLAVLIIAVVLGLRKRTVNNRLRLRGVWAGSKSLKVRNEGGQSGYEAMSDLTTNGQNSGEKTGFVGMQGASYGPPTSPRALPSAYGSEGVNGGGLASPKVSVLYKTVVARSYVPTLPDELAIKTGEGLKVLQEFDDGWSECMNTAGEVGMVPLECFGRQGGFGRQTSLGR
jgi:hypothetical protein